MEERKKATDYPQELLDLFHEYQHGDIDRRDFLERAKKFAIGGVTALALFESLKPNYAWAQQVKPDDPKIKTSRETVPAPEGHGEIKGYFAQPAKAGKYPAVIVIHENRGLNPYIEDVARRFAMADFIAYAPDGLTSVGGYPGNDEEGAVKFREASGPKMFEDFVAAAKWVKARPTSNSKLGAIGFCFGGGIVNQLAVRLGSDLTAGAPFYGAPVADADVPKIQAAMVLNFADPTKDTGIGARIPAFKAALEANHKNAQVYIYDGAQHGFHNDTTPRYDEAAAKLAWSRTMELFNKTLR
jgi:carboxymethylenebutenolidase